MQIINSCIYIPPSFPPLLLLLFSLDYIVSFSYSHLIFISVCSFFLFFFLTGNRLGFCLDRQHIAMTTDEKPQYAFTIILCTHTQIDLSSLLYAIKYFWRSLLGIFHRNVQLHNVERCSNGGYFVHVVILWSGLKTVDTGAIALFPRLFLILFL